VNSSETLISYLLVNLLPRNSHANPPFSPRSCRLRCGVLLPRICQVFMSKDVALRVEVWGAQPSSRHRPAPPAPGQAGTDGPLIGTGPEPPHLTASPVTIKTKTAAAPEGGGTPLEPTPPPPPPPSSSSSSSSWFDRWSSKEPEVKPPTEASATSAAPASGSASGSRGFWDDSSDFSLGDYLRRRFTGDDQSPGGAPGHGSAAAAEEAVDRALGVSTGGGGGGGASPTTPSRAVAAGADAGAEPESPAWVGPPRPPSPTLWEKITSPSSPDRPPSPTFWEKITASVAAPVASAAAASAPAEPAPAVKSLLMDNEH